MYGQTTTIVIPAYNEERRFPESLPQLRDALSRNGNLDLVIVDDGSTDRTIPTATELLRGCDRVRLLRLPWNQGKGGALKAGVAAAAGDVIVIMDADLSGDLGDLPRLVEVLDHADVSLGSRMAAGSKVVYQSDGRRLSSRVFNLIACSVAGVEASDTQCGYKAFRAPVAKLLFHLSKTDGFAVDVELLLLSKILGLEVREVPINWVERSGSSVKPARDAVGMVRDTLRARRSATRTAEKRGAGLRVTQDLVESAGGYFVSPPPGDGGGNRSGSEPPKVTASGAGWVPSIVPGAGTPATASVGGPEPAEPRERMELPR